MTHKLKLPIHVPTTQKARKRMTKAILAECDRRDSDLYELITPTAFTADMPDQLQRANDDRRRANRQLRSLALGLRLFDDVTDHQRDHHARTGAMT